MPSVLDIDGLLIATPALAFVLFVFISGWLVGLLARRAGAEEGVLTRIAEQSLMIGVVAARIAFAVEHSSAYRANPISILYFWQPGYDFWAGLAGGGVYGAWKIVRRDARLRHSIVFVGGMLPPLLAFLFVILTLNQFAPAGQLQIGMKAPALNLVGLDGKPTSLADRCGKPVILNIWATWCSACREEIPLLNRTYQKWKASGLQLVGVDLAEPAPRIRRFLVQVPMSYPIWLDPPGRNTRSSPSPTTALFKQVGGVGLPTTLFINRNGVIRLIKIGELSPATLTVDMGRIGVGPDAATAGQVASTNSPGSAPRC